MERSCLWQSLRIRCPWSVHKINSCIWETEREVGFHYIFLYCFFSFKFYVTGLLLNLNLIFKKLSFQTDSGPTKLPEVRSDRSPHSFPTDDFPRCFFLDPNLGLPKTKINFIFISASGIYATSLSLCPEKNIGISRLICSSSGGDSQREAC